MTSYPFRSARFLLASAAVLALVAGAAPSASAGDAPAAPEGAPTTGATGESATARDGATDMKPDRGLRRDPIETDPNYAEAFRTIDDEVKAELSNDPTYRGPGDFDRYWQAKKALLKRRYGIEWKTPGEMNPDVMFD